MTTDDTGKILVTGATGFIGRTLVQRLLADGKQIVATSRQPPTAREPGIEWRRCDLLEPDTLPGALAGTRVAYYLVHSMGESDPDYRALERRAAQAFAEAAHNAGLRRIVYLGGPAPAENPSEHLLSRLEVGQVLRSGEVSTVELRASMVIGYGSTSWQIVRDLAMRLPAMVLPKWLRSRTRPVALDDVVAALVGAADLELEGSTWFDIPGPEELSGREILERVAALRGRKIVVLEIPLLTPQLSALWLKLVTRSNFGLARELVAGLREDLLPADDSFWQKIGHTGLIGFDEAARRALAQEHSSSLWESLIDLIGSKQAN